MEPDIIVLMNRNTRKLLVVDDDAKLRELLQRYLTEQQFEVSLAADPENANYLDTKGWILCRQGDAEGGMAWLQRADEGFTGTNDEVREHLETCASSAVAR